MLLHQKKIIPPPQAKVQVPQARQKTFVTPIIVQHNPIIPPPDTRELITSAISDRTLDGPADIGIATVEKLNATQASTQTEPAKEVKPDQKEPEFPGGQEAWLNFLRKNLVAPEGLEPGEKKTVAIRFLVATNGTVTGFEVLQSAGRSFDNEVIRVLKKMPRWKPAILNGQPLERAFTQPVTFVGVEE